MSHIFPDAASFDILTQIIIIMIHLKQQQENNNFIRLTIKDTLSHLLSSLPLSLPPPPLPSLPLSPHVNYDRDL